MNDQQKKFYRPLVLLDRDGVINHDSSEYIKSPTEWNPIPGVMEAIARLTQMRCRVVVCTNQSGIARGLFTESTLGDIHATMLQQAASAGGLIDAVYYCPHAPDAGCDCRKPKTGMLEQAFADYPATLDRVWFLGDSKRDMQAALTFGCQPLLVRTGNGSQHESAVRALGVNNIFDDLTMAVDWLIALLSES